MLTGAAECFVAAPGVVVDAVFAAIVEASVTDGIEAVANVVARPATAVVVVGVVADGISVGNPVVFNPAGAFPPS